LKRFDFSLEKVLKLRAWDEKEAKAGLGRAVRALRMIEEAIKQNDAARLEAGKKRSAAGAGFAGDFSSAFAVHEAFIIRLDIEKKELLARAEEAALEMEKKTAAWKEAKAALKTLENLKDRQFKAWRKDAISKDTE